MYKMTNMSNSYFNSIAQSNEMWHIEALMYSYTVHPLCITHTLVNEERWGAGGGRKPRDPPGWMRDEIWKQLRLQN